MRNDLRPPDHKTFTQVHAFEFFELGVMVHFQIALDSSQSGLRQ